MPPWRAAAWLTLLAIVPWWLGLPLLLAIVVALLIPTPRLTSQLPMLRRALRWGLPGMLLSLQRELGGDALAWGAALLGALAGFTLLAGLEAWLDRGQHRPGAVALQAAPEWPASASGSLGPPAAIIELARPRWHEAGGELADPRGGMARWQAADLSRGRWQLGDGHQLDDARPCGTFSPDGRWFATQPADERGLLLLDRERNRLHRLRGWKLCGWHTEPWLMRSGRAEPMPLREVLGQLRQWWS
jgi:hypothetical protein